ncbi:MAG TPA: hypothetical protein VF581_05595 [Flavobacterium sp.]|jgi:type IV pilus assembly protein PilQ
MRTTFALFFLLLFNIGLSQDNRIQQIQNNLEAIGAEAPGLSEKVNINIKEATLSSFLIAISEIHKVNISVAPALSKITIINNFTDVTVADLLVFLCKEYNLTIEFTGNIIAIKPYEAPKEIPAERLITAHYSAPDDLLSVDLKSDGLYQSFRKIMEVTGKNIVFAPGMENLPLTAYIVNTPFDVAMNKLAYANNLSVSKTRDNFYVFDTFEGGASGNEGSQSNRQSKPQRARKSNFFFNVVDSEKKLLEVDFENTPIANIINDIGHELNLDMFVSTPLESAGNATVKAKLITFDELMLKIFENRIENSTTAAQYSGNGSQVDAQVFTFKNNGNVYYFGTKLQLVVRNIKAIPLMHRSIELLSDPTREGRSAGRTTNGNPYTNYGNGSEANNANYQNNTNNPTSSNSIASTSLLSIVPDEIKMDLDIRIDKELNSFIVNGPASNIERFETFIKYLDKPVPVILIEVMLLEISRSAIVETGINAGIGDKPVATKGTVFPNTDITLGAQTINKIINRFDGFGSLNIGNVIPDFYLSIKAMESNGNLKVRSSPRLSTLNGHKAYLSIGETTYYVVTNQSFYGTQIPQASEIKNYQPIDAELSVTIMPLVSGDGQITMDIKVIQSSFNGQKVDKDAPPGINSREFTSIIRVKDQDIIVLGGLEEKVKKDAGSGVPLLARIPVLKWLFSSRKREDSTKKLTVLIKPTVIY